MSASSRRHDGICMEITCGGRGHQKNRASKTTFTRVGHCRCKDLGITQGVECTAASLPSAAAVATTEAGFIRNAKALSTGVDPHCRCQCAAARPPPLKDNTTVPECETRFGSWISPRSWGSLNWPTVSVVHQCCDDLVRQPRIESSLGASPFSLQ